MKRNNVKKEISDRDYVGFIEFPSKYCTFPVSLKQKIGEKIIDSLFYQIDKLLSDPEINRFEYVLSVFESTLINAIEDEEYEYCALIRDCITLMNEPNPE
jgi:hypothetical protein